VLIWEASRNYHYARTTAVGRIILGGEDDPALIEPEARNQATPAKVAALKNYLNHFGRRHRTGSTSPGPALSIPPMMACR
jgi:hypothetical protein